MTGDVIEPDLHIPENEFNFGGVPVLMKAIQQFHIENKVKKTKKKFFLIKFKSMAEIAKWLRRLARMIFN